MRSKLTKLTKPQICGFGNHAYCVRRLRRVACESPRVEMVDRVLAWMRDNVALADKVVDRTSSYGWKHTAERALADYVSNGEFIQAAIAFGAEIFGHENSPNTLHNLFYHRLEERLQLLRDGHEPGPGEDQVYLIRASRSGLIKIGHTNRHPEIRLSQLQTSAPEKLELLASLPGDVALERYLHRRFAAHRQIGEWFEASLKLQEFIQALLAARDAGLARRP